MNNNLCFIYSALADALLRNIDNMHWGKIILKADIFFMRKKAKFINSWTLK